MFAYLGLESATVPAGDVRDPTRTIPRSTIIGISMAALLYILGTVVVLGVVPHQQLLTSVAPFSDAARLMWGAWGAWAIALAVILSSIGALNGWTLMMGQVPMAAAQDGLFPSVFGKLSERGVPALGMVLSAALATAMVALQALGSPGVRAFYKLVVSLSTMAAVIPYAFCSLAVGLIAARNGDGKAPRIGAVEIIAFIFSVFTIYGCGPTAVLYGLHAARARNSGVCLAAAPCCLVDAPLGHCPSTSGSRINPRLRLSGHSSARAFADRAPSSTAWSSLLPRSLDPERKATLNSLGPSLDEKLDSRRLTYPRCRSRRYRSITGRGLLELAEQPVVQIEQQVRRPGTCQRRPGRSPPRPCDGTRLC